MITLNGQQVSIISAADGWVTVRFHGRERVRVVAVSQLREEKPGELDSAVRTASRLAMRQERAERMDRQKLPRTPANGSSNASLTHSAIRQHPEVEKCVLEAARGQDTLSQEGVTSSQRRFCLHCGQYIPLIDTGYNHLSGCPLYQPDDPSQCLSRPGPAKPTLKWDTRDLM